MSETSEKQNEANRQNAQHSTGPKSDEGKEKSKYNSIRHGILKEAISDYEREFYESIVGEMETYFKPVGLLENALVDRIALYTIKLYRTAKAEGEFMKATLNPRVSERKYELKFDIRGEEIVKQKGYTPIVKYEVVEKLSGIYLRYEISLENRLYKAIHELQRIQATRKGENPSSLTIDINGPNE